MAKRMLRTLLIDANARKVEEVELQDDLEAFYEMLNCRCIDIVQRPIGGKWYHVMLDDEGLLQDEIIPTAVSIDQKTRDVLVGNLMFFNTNSKGDLVSLTDDDVEWIKDHICVFVDMEHDAFRPILKIW